MEKKTLTYAKFYDLYAVALFVCVFIIIPFGIYPSLKEYSKKRTNIQKLEQKNNQLNQILSDIKNLKYLEEDVAPYVQRLEEAIPSDFSGETFVRDVVLTAIKSEYSMKSANFTHNPLNNNVSIDLILQGNFNNLPKFIADLENLPISIAINSVDINLSGKTGARDKDKDLVKIQLTAFVLPKLSQVEKQNKGSKN